MKLVLVVISTFIFGCTAQVFNSQIETSDLASLASAVEQPTAIPSLPNSLILSNGSTGGTVSTPNSALDTTCLQNSQFEACIFVKNPVYQKSSSFSSFLNFGADLTLQQTYGVKLQNLSGTYLNNGTIHVGATDGPQATRNADGNWKYLYKDDASNHRLAQVITYYWIDWQETQMKKLTGTFYASQQNIPIDAYDSTVEDNAFWDGKYIVLGRAISGSRGHEMALSPEITMHEMGHANLAFATQTEMSIDNNGNGKYCYTVEGCLVGINEGQADFHTVLMFPESPVLGETSMNTLGGLPGRDPRTNQNLSASDFFNMGPTRGEVHNMGALYNSILYSIYMNPNVVKEDFAKIFNLHLKQLSRSTRFAQARDLLKAQDAAYYSGKYSAIIQQAFDARGL